MPNNPSASVAYSRDLDINPSGFASTSYTHGGENLNFTSSQPPRKGDPSYATHTPLRSHNDPHASHPFRRYYLGPSPVSSGQANQIAQAIKADTQITHPVGLAVAGRPGFVWIRPPLPEDAVYLSDEEEVTAQRTLDRPKAPRKAKSFSSALIGGASVSPLPKIRALRRDASQSSTRSFVSARSNLEPQPLQSSKAVDPANLRGIRRFAEDTGARLPLRRDISAMGRLEGRGGSSPEPSQSNNGRQQLSSEAREGLSGMRRGRSNGGPGTAGSRGEHLAQLSLSVETPTNRLSDWSSDASPSHFITSGDMTLSSYPMNSARTADAPPMPNGNDTARVVDDWSSEEETTVTNSRRGNTKDSDALISTKSTTAESRTPRTAASTHFDVAQLERTRLASNMASKPHSRSQSRAFSRSKEGHGREVSRQSRFSIMSGNTIDSVGTRLTEGSFGASGGFRARIMRAFKPNLRHHETPASRHRPRHHKASEGEIQHRLWRAGVAPGKVGTSAGGTKWVGQSFEVGARFWDVLESRRSEGTERVSETTERGRGTTFSKEDKVGVDRMTRSPKSKGASDAATVKKVSLSPAAVLTAFARDAQDNHDGKEMDRTRSNPPAAQPSPEGLATQTHSDTAGIESATAITPSNDSTCLPAVNPSNLRSKPSITSIAPEALGSLDKQIEARSGWDDIVSLMTSAHRRSEISRPKFKGGPKSIPDSQNVVSAERSNGADAPAIEKAESPSKGLLAPPLRRTETSKSSQSGGTVFYTPLETSNRTKGTASPQGPENPEQVDYFVGSGSSSSDRKLEPSSPLRRMTLSEALSHPEPPLAADDRFPEAVHDLVRRLSGSALSPHVGTSDTASDHAVAARPTTPIIPLAAPSPYFASPGGISDTSYAHSACPQQYGGAAANVDRINSLTASDTPLLKNKASTTSVIVHDLSAERPSVFAQANGKKTPARKKTVQFDKRDIPSRPFAVRSLSASFLTPGLNGKRNATAFSPNEASTPSGAGSPAPADVVLSRAHSTSTGLSARERSRNDRFEAGEEDFITRRSILRRDRMLVRNEWTSSETISQGVDETTIRGLALHPGVWRQHMVVLRPGRLELWTDPSAASKFLGRKQCLHLSFVVPLVRGSTFVSIFSPIDRIFCLTFAQSLAATHVSGGGQYKMLNLRRSGTNILLFDARSLSVSADWIWDLWREVGGIIPEALEVHVPMLDFRIKFPIPETMPLADDDSDGDNKIMLRNGSKALMLQPTLPKEASSTTIQGEGFKMMSRHRIVSTILKIIQQQPEWEHPLRIALERGAKFELAWRRGTSLDWIINDQTLDGKARFWSVMCGSVLKEAKTPAILEFRLADHYPTAVVLGSGEKLVEPPGLEGFIWRVKPVSGILTRVYASTHSSHCFISRPSRAFPPDRHLAVGHSDVDDLRDDDPVCNTPMPPPTRASTTLSGMTTHQRRKKARDEPFPGLRQQVVEAADTVATTPEEIQAQVEAFRASEKRRQLDQISHADGYIDVKDIMILRYLGRSEDETEIRKPDADKPINMPLSGPTPNEVAGVEDSTGRGPQEDIDVGGEEGLNLATDRNALRRARQFEVVMTNGRVTRFEAYSISVAKEWVARMHDLSVYWKRREKVDALELMEASGYDRSLIRKRMNEGHSLDRIMHSISDGVVNPALLSIIWNWCAVMGCRGIIRCGQLFTKPRAFAPYQSRYYILIAGRLLRYKLLVSTRTARSRQNAGIFHRRTDTVIHLRDAYLWTGRLADDMLAHTRSEGAGSMGSFASGGAPNTGGAQGRHKLPRIYADGLLSIDEDEDCTFVIRYRPQRVNQPTAPSVPVGIGATSDRTDKSGAPDAVPRAKIGGDLLSATAVTRDGRRVSAAGSGTAQQSATESARDESALLGRTDNGGNSHSTTSSSIPRLDDGIHKDIVLRARSKLERDLWVRCIGYEIERLAREDVQRETKIKETGETPYKGV